MDSLAVSNDHSNARGRAVRNVRPRRGSRLREVRANHVRHEAASGRSGNARLHATENVMRCSRRNLVTGLAGLAGAGLAPRVLRAFDVEFDTDPFTLGVASGYPEPTAVVLWTRLAPEPLAPGGGLAPEAVPVEWEIAEDDAFRRVVRAGLAHAVGAWGHSVHVEAAGLAPGRDYWYRFRSGGAESPIGRTRTAPAEGARAFDIAVASCQHYESGHYAAYGAIARDLPDLVIHVGDYIYENRGVERVRAHDAHECYTLDDYRQRYAIYKSDPELKAAHAGAPWMVTWDDHEVDNDYADSDNNDEDPPELFLARRAAAYRAYYEHLPLPRRLIPFGAHQRLHARRALGDLVEVHMLDGRQHRSPQACGAGRVRPCEALFAEERTMLGRAQERWLEAGLGASRARWQLLAQQTVFARMDQEPGPEIGYWNDGWSGYPAARRRLVDVIAARGAANTVVLSGDIHAFLANDVHAGDGGAHNAVVAAELVTTSISSPGPPQAIVDTWRAENPNVHLARSDLRGYTRLRVARDRLTADLVAVDDARRADSGTHVLASFEIERGRPGIHR
jgi:alkaline phosphatase D